MNELPLVVLHVSFLLYRWPFFHQHSFFPPSTMLEHHFFSDLQLVMGFLLFPQRSFFRPLNQLLLLPSSASQKSGKTQSFFPPSRSIPLVPHPEKGKLQSPQPLVFIFCTILRINEYHAFPAGLIPSHLKVALIVPRLPIHKCGPDCWNWNPTLHSNSHIFDLCHK